MNNIKLTALAITALITTSLAIWLSVASQTPTSDPTVAKYLLGNIQPSLIDTIVIGTGEEEVTIKRIGKQFLVRTKDNYPANITEINDLINKCSDIKITELYTADPDNHKVLGVLVENATSQVKFLKKGGELITGVIIGSTKEAAKGTYIRETGKNEVYVTLENPRIRTGAMDYMDQSIFQAITREDIESVIVTQSGDRYTLTVNEHDEIVIDHEPEGKIFKYEEAGKVFTALSSLRFIDVKKDTGALDFNKSYICKLADKTAYNVFLIETGDKTYLTCNALYKGQALSRTKEFSTQDELKDKEARYLARENAVKFSNRHGGWVYEITARSAKNLIKPLDELFEELEIPETTEDPNEPAVEIIPTPAETPAPDTTM